MLFIIGLIVVIGCVFGGYASHGGNLKILWQPVELVIIGGAAIGAFIISAPGSLIKDVLKGLKKLFKGKPYKKKDYVELLTFLFTLFKLIKGKGMLAVESHIENPHESDVFKKAPSLLHDHHVVDFICDYLRLVTMGMDNHFQLEDLMEKEIEIHHHEAAAVAGSISSIADGMPALGIVAAVLGIITTMQSISEPPEVLGGLIAIALVGTFLGVFLAYGIISPIGTFMGRFADAETQYYQCIKAAILAHMQGNAPTVSIEFARKVIPSHERPGFKELEDALNAAA
jgi:chemotaxis protein MotA